MAVRTGSRLSGGGDGYEGDKTGLGAVGVGLGWCAQQDVPGADASGKRTVARSVALVPGHDRLGHCPGLVPGCSHHRQMGHRPFSEGGPAALIFEQSGGSPPSSARNSQAELKCCGPEVAPATAGIALANWNWKVVRQFVSERCGVSA